MSAADAGKLALLVFTAAILQTAIVGSLDVAGGAPDLMLVLLVAVALTRGALVGAAAGFFGGLLVDTATLATLGVTSLILTGIGYWIGRYGETTGRHRTHAPVLSVLAATLLYAVGAYALRFLLGSELSARHVLVDALLPAAMFNLLLTVPLFAMVRALLPRPDRAERGREVRLLV